jgi:putative tryptophan/tyrosine transport system substrate-binding protein
VVRTTPAALAARAVSQTIPIVILSAIDPVRSGLVASLARPGGNITGLTTLAPDLSAKRVQLLKETIPRLFAPGRALEFRQSRERGGVERNPGGGANAGSPGPVPAGRGREGLRARVRADRQGGPDALLVVEDALTVGHTKQIADFAIRERLAMMLGNPALLEGGGLIGYGPDVREMARRGAYYVDISKHVGRVNRESIVVDAVAA